MSLSRDALLHQLFEAQAARTPDAVAVVSRSILDQRELNARAINSPTPSKAWRRARLTRRDLRYL